MRTKKDELTDLPYVQKGFTLYIFKEVGSRGLKKA
ncbi:hypothetical protein M8C21_002512 [Ambrosia artemisiifolia]|uniref:Uncharacterized protein n=1 Tax=Ambrosia artemisiifolia TaxID=4212 RepID=A0AAD5CRQ4_AMBAR|nr:hypothetical protein M8C21_002512 [Ambrosia artemisiifolia]